MNDRDQDIVNGLNVLKHDLGRIGEYVQGSMDNISDLISRIEDAQPPTVDPPVDPPEGLVDHNNLHGIYLNPELESYGPVPSSAPSYSWTLQGANYGTNQPFRIVRTARSSVLMMKGMSRLSNFHAFESEGDGIKFGYGVDGDRAQCVLKNGWIYGLGLNPTAHADGAQDQGGLEYLRCEDINIWMPCQLGDGSQSNAALFFNSKNDDIGLIEFVDGILYGGNFTVYAINKGNGKKVADLNIKRTPFIMDQFTPQYGFAFNGGHSTISTEECAVYFRDRDTGLMTLISNDPLGLDVNYWRDQNLDSNGNLITS